MNRRQLLTLAALAAGAARPARADSVVPLVHAHAHNDYEHPRPLLDALDRGFCSVEADVHFVDGKLLVAHDRAAVRPERTLEALYLDPLRSRVRANGGRVFPGGPELTLLVDIKGEAEATYAVLRRLLEPYAEMLTRFEDGQVRVGAVTVILSGNRPRAVLESEPRRLAAMDGRLEDLGKGAPRSLIPLVSQAWWPGFKWLGDGPFPEAERNRLRDLVRQAHAEGRRLRFWATPDRPEVWKELSAAGVDLLNADRLEALRDFLLAQRG